MVKICPNNYPVSSEKKYSQYFEKHPFPLSSFQKYAIEAIVEENHILVTAHTGSGKTLPAEFAIEYFVSKGKKVIYTSPIKALSNQKFYEFTKKFPHISFGILTGDIKSNPEADVLIMTTEILMNTLYMKNHKVSESEKTNVNLAMFEMDFEKELACVVFDEIHYINDLDRGKVWEETIMMLPKHIQMVMLSATLDSPEKFALWCETRGDILTKPEKIVYLTTTYERVVPLTHYSFISCTQGLFKILKDKQLEKEIMKNINTLHIIQDSSGNFKEETFQKIKTTLKLFETKRHVVKRQHVLNQVSKHMVENNMLPAICFILSRKALEQSAKEITTVLLEDDSKVPYLVKTECEQIIRKLPNYQEYLKLPEYVNMISLLEKGIAIHHAGIMPILREMVELLFAKGYVKLLFATETFAVGINMPTKTVLFTDTSKFDGTHSRILFSHEYTQMAGRAGRRGIDTVGHVIHLANLYRNTDITEIRNMMKGQPQKLVSKFKISYNLLLNLVDIGETDYTRYAKRSMVQGDIENITKYYYDEIMKNTNDLEKMQSSLSYLRTPKKIVEEYIDLKSKKINSVNKKRKEIEKILQSINDEYKYVDKDVETVVKYNKNYEDLHKLNDKITETESSLDTNIKIVFNILQELEFVKKIDGVFTLSLKGQIACQLREIHCLVFSELILNNKLKQFSSKELIGIFSCFTNIHVSDELKNISPNTQHLSVRNMILEVSEMYKKQNDKENKYQIDTGIDYNMHFDLIDYSMRWCDCENEADCKKVLQEMSLNKDIFLGEFVKAILKINNISSEMERIAELIGDMELLHKLRKIPELTLKYVATNQSLYI